MPFRLNKMMISQSGLHLLWVLMSDRLQEIMLYVKWNTMTLQHCWGKHHGSISWFTNTEKRGFQISPKQLTRVNIWNQQHLGNGQIVLSVREHLVERANVSLRAADRLYIVIIMWDLLSRSHQHIPHRLDGLHRERTWETSRMLSGPQHWLVCEMQNTIEGPFCVRETLRLTCPPPWRLTRRLKLTKRGRAHIGHGSFVAEAYSLFTWSEKQTANQLHSCHWATRRRHKLFMTRQRKGSRMRGK